MRWLRKFYKSLKSGFGIPKKLYSAWRSVSGTIRSVWQAGILRTSYRMFVKMVRSFWSAIRWSKALDWRLLLQGAPALLVAIGVVVVSVAASTQQLDTPYLSAARSAMNDATITTDPAKAAQKYQEALACYERLTQLEHDRSDILYEMAEAALGSGDGERCLKLMERLASTNNPSKKENPKAHFWLGQFLIPRYIADADARRKAEYHLKEALKGDIDSTSITRSHHRLGLIYRADRQFGKAIQELSIAAAKDTFARMDYMLALAMNGNVEQAKAEGERVAKELSEIARSTGRTLRERMAARIVWSEALAFRDQFPEAVEVLRTGLAETNDNIFRERLANVYIAWVNTLTIQGNPDPVARLQHISTGLDYLANQPNHPLTLQLSNQLLYVTGIRGEFLRSLPQFVSTFGLAMSGQDPCQITGEILIIQNDEGRKARELLRKLATQAKGSAAVHFAVGVDLWEQAMRLPDGEEKKNLVGESRWHYEYATKVDPKMPDVANNLAWLLLYQSENHVDKTLLPRALEFANAAISNAPRTSSHRDTRGRILAKMGDVEAKANNQKAAEVHYKAALDDLYDYLKTPTLPPAAKESVHRALADVHQKLGHTVEAANQRREADLLKNPPPRKK